MRHVDKGALYVAMAFGAATSVFASIAYAQTTAGMSTTVVFPLTAQTPSFASEVTLFNPGPNVLNAAVAFYEGNNSGAPGPKTCNDVVVSAGRAVQITLATQCALGPGGHFGLLVVSDKAQPPVNAFYGFIRVQNPVGNGFSVEGFPVANFNDQVSHATGLKRQAAAPTFQTNCFVGSLEQPVNYELRLFNGTTGAQIGGTLSGALQAFQQFRYLDVFGAGGVNAPAGDQFNVRAEFTPTSGPNARLIGFCTVQDNTSFGGDFRIAKSFGSPITNAFVQGGNAFGTVAHLGTNDNQPLELYANGQRVMRYVPDALSPSIVGGPVNSVGAGATGAVVAGGGAPGTSVLAEDCGTSCGNSAASFSSVGGGVGNVAGGAEGPFATVAGGIRNQALGYASVIGGGQANSTPGGYATISGGFANATGEVITTIGGGVFNVASGQYATVGGGDSNHATGDHTAVGGGGQNTASGSGSTIAGGRGNTATFGSGTVVGGGSGNVASGSFATVPGGSSNQAQGIGSMAAGMQAIAANHHSFIWNGWSSGSAGTFRNNVVQFHGEAGLDIEYGTRRADGGGTSWVYIGSVGFPGQAIATSTGAFLSSGGIWTNNSDRHRKTEIRAVDPHAILAAVAQLPISTWQYVDETNGVRHLGPMAQDFRAAFGLGIDEKAIGTVDADGVALAAIQALHALVNDKDARISALESRLSEVDVMQREIAALRSALADVMRQRDTHGGSVRSD